MLYDPNLVVPPEVVKAVQTIREFAAKHTASDNWEIFGLTPSSNIRKLEIDRDVYKRMWASYVAVYAVIEKEMNGVGDSQPGGLLESLRRSKNV